MSSINVSRVCVALLFALIATFAAWQFSTEFSLQRLLAAAALTIPLWVPLRGLLRRNRKTYAWATLCVIPYFIIGTTEAVANPQYRAWSGLCLALALLLFGSLILYLRVTRAESG
jgi:uncharacterized membrane protein